VRVGEPRALETGDLIQLGDYRLEVAEESATAHTSRASTDSTSPSGVPRHSLTGQPDRLVMLVGPNPGMEFPLRDQAVIGRGEECDISLNHGSVSRVHAEIQTLGDGRYEIIDRESANGVRVNGAELQRALLDARDTIELGDIVLKYIPAGMIYRPGADESQQISAYATAPEPVPSSPGLATDSIPATMLTPGRIAAVGAALVLALILGVVIVGVGGNENPVVAPAAEADGAARVLAEAKALLDQGNVEAAHARLAGIPDTSNTRQSSEFFEVEARWADDLFRQANEQADRELKREVLERIAEAASVDSERRKRAADMIAALDSGGVDISQLPPAEPAPSNDQPVDSGIDESTDTADAVAAKAAPARPTHATTATHSPRPAATTTSKAPVASTASTRDPAKGAMSGNRSAQLAAINAYKAKRAAGTLSDKEARLLRALCRQHGIADCSD